MQRPSFKFWYAAIYRVLFFIFTPLFYFTSVALYLFFSDSNFFIFHFGLLWLNLTKPLFRNGFGYWSHSSMPNNPKMPEIKIERRHKRNVYFYFQPLHYSFINTILKKKKAHFQLKWLLLVFLITVCIWLVAVSKHFPVHRNQNLQRSENLAGSRSPAISYMRCWA